MSRKDLQKFFSDEAAQGIAETLARRISGSERNRTTDGDLAVTNLATRAGMAVAFPESGLLEEHLSDEPAIHDIEGLLKELSNGSPLHAPRKQIVRGGVFFAAHLLYEGWWARSPRQTGLVSGDWVGGKGSVSNIRRWLNLGYEQWAPSWNLWSPDERGSDQCLFGQIGSGDEANSLHVIVAPNAAARLLSHMGDRLAVGVVAKGTLYHTNHKMEGLEENIRRALTPPIAGESEDNTEDAAISYYMVISDFETDGRHSRDAIEVNIKQPPVYSAYMWHCLIRQSDERLARNGAILLPNTIFVWEHTNLMDRDCIDFNYQSLLFKREYLEKRLGGERLMLLQRSYGVDAILRQKPQESLLFGSQDLRSIFRKTRTILSRAKKDSEPGTVVTFRGGPKSRQRGK